MTESSVSNVNERLLGTGKYRSITYIRRLAACHAMFILARWTGLNQVVPLRLVNAKVMKTSSVRLILCDRCGVAITLSCIVLSLIHGLSMQFNASDGVKVSHAECAN